jgi:hypothetical protein
MRPCFSFKRVTDAWAKETGINLRSVGFSFDGRLLLPEWTPEELGMENGDVIDAT